MSTTAHCLRIALVSDAWLPQVNGVVRTLTTTVSQLRTVGHDVLVLEPALFRSVPCPTYPEIRLAWRPKQRLDELLSDFAPDAIHIATEGPLGHAARRWCLQRKLPFTTAYHTQFPEYLAARAPIPLSLSYGYLRRFHGAATRTMVATPSLESQLQARGFQQLVRWSRGVDVELFQPASRDGKAYLGWERPIFAYSGRVSVEKNIEAFLRLSLPGTKVVIGGGPALRDLQHRYPDVRFVGYRFGQELVRYLAAADAFVFPSLTDTFGLVMLEAMACGLPVAAFPVTGPIDVVRNGVTGVLHEDLQTAALQALQLDPAACRQQALEFSWQRATQQFLNNLQPFTESASRAAA